MNFYSLAFAEPVKVGTILVLSGENASIGQACQNGMTLGLEALPKEISDKIQITYEDDQLQAKNTVTGFNKLVASQNIDLAVTLSSGTSKAIAHLAEQKKIPLIALATDPAIVAKRKYVFNFWVTPEEEVRVLLIRLKQLGYKRIVRVGAQHDAVLAIYKAFDEINAGQIEIVLDELYQPSDKDFRTFIAKVKQRQNLDGIFVELFFGQSGLFAKQARELGVDLPLFNVETFEDPNELKLSGGALAGNWYIQADEPTGEFLELYKQRFPDQTYFSAANCHDTIALIGQAIKQGKAKDRDQLREFFANVKDFIGATGTFSSTGDNRFSLPATVKIVTEDGFEKLES